MACSQWKTGNIASSKFSWRLLENLMARPTATTDNRQVAGYAKTESISDVSCTGSSFTTTNHYLWICLLCVISSAWSFELNVLQSVPGCTAYSSRPLLHCIALYCHALHGVHATPIWTRTTYFIKKAAVFHNALSPSHSGLLRSKSIHNLPYLGLHFIVKIVTILPAIIPPISQSIYMFTKCYYKVKHFCWTNLSLHILIIHLLHASVMFVVL